MKTPDQGRIWVYRNWLPSESLNLANIEVNGVYFGSVENGGAFYRDMPPELITFCGELGTRPQ